MSKPRGRRGDFWSKVAVGDIDDCWPWSGTTDQDGYGLVRVNKKLQKAHRRGFELIYGPLLEGLVVRHFVCDNPPCCNFLHLLKGTHQQNTQDALSKGRLPQIAVISQSRHARARGENNGRAKLTEAQVEEIRAYWTTGKITKRQLGHVFKVTDVLIGKIVRREIWAHVRSQ